MIKERTHANFMVRLRNVYVRCSGFHSKSKYFLDMIEENRPIQVEVSQTCIETSQNV